MDRHFGCTACGKCCYGGLPLTLKDALAHAGRFPLAVVLTPVRQGAKAFAVTERLGFAIRTRDKKKLAVGIAPTAYLPPTLPCPALTPDALCGIQAEKPLRCRTMPFFPFREEYDQADLLIPRQGWICDVSAAAPVVYRDKTIIDRSDFDAERAALVEQAPVLRSYAEWLVGAAPGVTDGLAKASMTPGCGRLAVSFASLLRRLDHPDRAALAASQIRVLTQYAELVAPQPAWADYRRNYLDWAWEMERLA
jgi:Fe-S-cluster containining protein